jgi:hypothetical protein
MKNRRIKLLTFSGENNCGAVLQCYALSKVLVGLNYTVELLHIPLPKSDYGFVGNLTHYRIGGLFFNRFRRKWLPYQVSLNDWRNNEDDIYVVGSDQVWNPALTKDTALHYFFNFLPDGAKRISYAASFGDSEWLYKDIEREVFTCLQKFSAIGVRENSGIQTCKNIFHVNATLTLDPAMLLDDYSELMVKKKRTHTKKTLITYLFVKKTPEWLQLIRFIGIQTHCRPVMLGERRMHKGISNILFPSVENWVSEIANSSFVITDTFHGVVFAILHKKQFIVILSNTNQSGRIISLLALLGIENRLYHTLEDLYNTAEWMKEIDYDTVFERLDKLRKYSISFLENSLK